VTPDARARLLLALGAAAGLAVAAASLVRVPGGPTLGKDVVARVNGIPVRTDDYLRALGAVATDRRAPLTDADKRRILDRLIDEELLVQRGLALGLARRDRTLRAQLAAATIDLLATTTAEPTVAELRAFYDEHRGYFVAPERIRARQVLVRVAGGSETAAAARAEEAAQRLRRGEAFAAVRTAVGDEEVAPLPDALLPPEKLREYVGETAAAAALRAPAGGVTDPVRTSMGFHVLVVVERTDAVVRPYDEVADLVRSEWRRREDDAALRASLDALRGAADVRTTDALP
jgi:parvulin-like peptidyl-prolyl isomerase